MTKIESIKSARNLTELRDALEMEERDESGEPITESSLELDRLMTDLPTFGGEEPGDTHRIWSWDAKHVLVEDGHRGEGYMIVPRDEYFETDE